MLDRFESIESCWKHIESFWGHNVVGVQGDRVAGDGAVRLHRAAYGDTVALQNARNWIILSDIEGSE